MDILIVACLCFVITGHNIAATSIKLTCEDIRELVDGHNYRRLMLATGTVEGQPPAKRMKSIVWDKELAAKAAGWVALAKQMIHNPDRTIPSNRFKVGENLYQYFTTNERTIMSMETSLTAWWDEHSDFKFGAIKKDPQTGHYSQMAWSNTTQLGCALDKSKIDEYYVHFIVCNYGPAGNILGKLPYEKGTASKKLECGIESNCAQMYGPDCEVY